MFIGIDDTDSVDGMCTTYLAAILWEKLSGAGSGGGYPRLIRLNPNIPYRTRGNGAVSMEVEGDPEEIKRTVLEYVRRYSVMDDERTNPGVVFIEALDDRKGRILNGFYLKAVSGLVTIEEAEEVAKKAGAEVHKFKNGRGIIGALAAVGAELPDRTYEIIAYRKEKKKEKRIDRDSVVEMDKETFPETFNNIDHKTGRILITPHGYDPVYCGIRGNSPEIVKKAWSIIKPLDEIERVQVFETNQGTDAHMRMRRISELKPYDCAILSGKVTAKPIKIEGGHVLFALSDGTGEIACAAYEPTGSFRETAMKLLPGDELDAYGSIGKYPRTLNLEKIRITHLEKEQVREPPVCCGKKMTSAGHEKGFKCRKCGRPAKQEQEHIKEADRGLAEGFYEADAGARRHLTKPLSRMK